MHPLPRLHTVEKGWRDPERFVFRPAKEPGFPGGGGHGGGVVAMPPLNLEAVQALALALVQALRCPRCRRAGMTAERHGCRR